MKKKIIIGIFSLLIVITAIIFIVGAIDTYIDEVANDDIMVGLGAVMVAVVGGFVVFYELDLFYTVYYFFAKPKTITKSILNIFSNLTLLLIFFSDYLAHILYIHLNIFKEDWLLPITLIFIYVILRIVYATLSKGQSVEENEILFIQES